MAQDTPSPPAISIIVVCWNNLDELQDTIASIRSQTFDDLEIVVSDGGSDPEMVAYIETTADRWRSGSDTGVYDAMNQGLDLATGALALFLNSGDHFASEASLAGLMAGRDHPDYRPRHTTLSGQTLFQHTRSAARWLVAPVAHARGLAHMSSAAPLAYLRALRFDDRFRIVGDLDLWQRLDVTGKLHIVTVDTVISVFHYGDGMSTMPVNNAIKAVEHLMMQHHLGKKFTTWDLCKEVLRLVRIECVSRLPISWRLWIWKTRHGWTPLAPTDPETGEGPQT